jgi:hypothetical protein
LCALSRSSPFAPVTKQLKHITGNVLGGRGEGEMILHSRAWQVAYLFCYKCCADEHDGKKKKKKQNPSKMSRRQDNKQSKCVGECKSVTQSVKYLPTMRHTVGTVQPNAWKLRVIHRSRDFNKTIFRKMLTHQVS